MTTLEGLLKMNENGTRKVFQVPGKGVWFKCTFKALHQIKKWGGRGSGSFWYFSPSF